MWTWEQESTYMQVFGVFFANICSFTPTCHLKTLYTFHFYGETMPVSSPRQNTPFIMKWKRLNSKFQVSIPIAAFITYPSNEANQREKTQQVNNSMNHRVFVLLPLTGSIFKWSTDVILVAHPPLLQDLTLHSLCPASIPPKQIH